MPNYSTKYCPRCGSSFVCRPDQPTICQCAGITLTMEERAYLKHTYRDCLCRRCLIEIHEGKK